MFRLFTQPQYFHTLENGHPHIIEGGRGTGKTTVLKCLSYEGQHALRKGSDVRDWHYYGLYFRVNSARASSFRGSDRSQEEWIRIFSHYSNLNICHLLTDFLTWYRDTVNSDIEIPTKVLRRIARSLHIRQVDTVDQFSESLYDAFIDFESNLNNADEEIKLSTLGHPIDIYFDAIGHIKDFKGKNFFVLIDEFENYDEWQQRVINTLVKQSSDKAYTFKIGVREMGLKDRTTLISTESLSSPSDYTRIDIGFGAIDENYKKFAYQVCNERLKLLSEDVCKIRDVKSLLPPLSDEEEAEILGIDEYIQPLQEIFAHLKLSKLMLGVIRLFHDHKNIGNYAVIARNYKKNEKKWENRYSNYSHSILFTLKKRKSGVRKYYAGWDVFVYLSGGNIRYLLELLDRSIVEAVGAEQSIIRTPIHYKIQTNAAVHIAEKNLRDLEGLSGLGQMLTRLVLSLGRVFGLIAEDPANQAPEKNQFHFTNEALSPETQNLVRDAVMNLAITRSRGTKLSSHGDIRDYDYMLHPIFAPFFVFSHRRKRKLMIRQEDFLDLIKNHSRAIEKLSKQQDVESESSNMQRLAF